MVLVKAAFEPPNKDDEFLQVVKELKDEKTVVEYLHDPSHRAPFGIARVLSSYLSRGNIAQGALGLEYADPGHSILDVLQMSRDQVERKGLDLNHDYFEGAVRDYLTVLQHYHNHGVAHRFIKSALHLLPPRLDSEQQWPDAVVTAPSYPCLKPGHRLRLSSLLARTDQAFALACRKDIQDVGTVMLEL